MKKTDFAPRTGALEYYLKGKNLYGVEVGVDVGAHAESILTHCDVQKLWLVDIWQNQWMEGYCAGRLTRWFHSVEMVKKPSLDAAKVFEADYFDFIYLVQLHAYETVKADFEAWWPKLRPGGILALRNYAEKNAGLKKAADEFIRDNGIVKFEIDTYLNEIVIFK